MYRRFVPLLLTACLSLGCSSSSRYELQRDDNGNTVRLDKRTGETALVIAGQVVTKEQLLTSATRPPFNIDPQLATSATWPPLQIASMTMRMTTILRHPQGDNGDVEIAYQIWLCPLSDEVLRSYNAGKLTGCNFYLVFQDEGGWEITRNLVFHMTTRKDGSTGTLCGYYEGTVSDLEVRTPSETQEHYRKLRTATLRTETCR